MPVHPPILRCLMPCSDEESAAARAEVECWRTEWEAARHAARPARRAAILTGPTLRDVDAAIDCHCGCHPRPADVGLHDGGPTCPCQLTPGERAANWDAWIEASAAFAGLRVSRG